MRAWLVRANVRGRARVGRWLREGECAIGWWELGPIPAGTCRDELRSWLRVTYPDRSDGTIGAWIGNLDRFINRMEVGDLVVTPDVADIHLGVIASGPRHVPEHEEAHRRRVRWITGSEPIWRGDLSPGARAKLTTMLTVADLSGVAEELLAHADAPGCRPRSPGRG